MKDLVFDLGTDKGGERHFTQTINPVGLVGLSACAQTDLDFQSSPSVAEKDEQIRNAL
jgi:hypothetical protein